MQNVQFDYWQDVIIVRFEDIDLQVATASKVTMNTSTNNLPLAPLRYKSSSFSVV